MSRTWWQMVAASTGIVLVLGLAGAPAAPADPDGGPGPSPGSVIDPELVAVLADEDQARFIVELSARADLGRAPAIPDFAARGEYVVDTLRRTAARSQRAALGLVADRGAAAESYWLRNELAVHGDLALAESLAELSGVIRIRAERRYPLVEPVARTAAQEVAAAAPEWGVARIGADQVWDLGVTGTDVVVANIDTGVDFTHPALINQYRGNLGGGTFSHDYNWWDPTGTCGDTPCDNVEHGTHVMGTIVGGDGSGPFTPDIGVAPGARWIAAKGCETIDCSESALLSAGQFVLAPTDSRGENPDPSRRPHIVNNSWSGNPGDPTYLDTVRAWRAAGIIPVFASGNPGPACGAGGSPGDFPESISVGATDAGDTIASFSGRGPSGFGKTNPDVSAPGVNVTSSIPRGGYAAFSGTSMASPHVAGTFALMLSAAPELVRQVDPARAVLRATALDIVDLSCGGDADGDPNNVYGDGRIDALAAVRQVAAGAALAGTITGERDRPVAGATVTADNGTRTFVATGDAAGDYELLLAAGRYTVTVSAFGHHDTVATVEIVGDQTTTRDFALTPLPRFTVSGRVSTTELAGQLRSATVEAVGTPVEPATTVGRGKYSLTLPRGTYTLRAAVGGCTTPVDVTVEVTRDLTRNFSLTPKIDNFGYGCRSVAPDWVDVHTPTGLFGDDVYGRVPMPFQFPFYGQRYSEVFIVSNGFLSFTDPLVAWSGPAAVPTAGLPNTGVYPLWSDLVVDEVASIEFGIIGRERDRQAFVIEYSNLREFGVGGRVDFEVKLWEDGRIDMLYRNNRGRPGDGRTALIGVENAAGSDAFQFSFQQASLHDGVAFRYEVMRSGTVSGVVTNANDGAPVAGARVTAQPGGRVATTGPDGSYTLRLVPGRHQVTASAPSHTSQEQPVWLPPRRSATADFVLRAARAQVSPAQVSASTELGTATTGTVQVTNTGSAPLTFDAVEVDQGRTPPELPPATPRPAVAADPAAPAPVIRPITWAPFPLPAGAAIPSAGGVAVDGPLPLVIDDPDDDAEGSMELTGVFGGSDGERLSVALEFSPTSPLDVLGGYVHLDVDQNPATGIDVRNFFGLPTQRAGVEYLADLWAVPPIGKVMILDAATGAIVAQADAQIDGQRLSFGVPLAALGGDDGAVDVTAVVGNEIRPTDWAPDQGKGTIEPDLDAAWMSVEPISGTLRPGESRELTVTLGGTGTDAGAYRGLLEVMTNDPRQPLQVAEVALDVTLPAGFGGLRGTTSDLRDGAPVPATVTVHAERDGEPYPVTAQASAVDGGYLLFAPAGTWPAEIRADGYQPVTEDVTVVAGAGRVHDVALRPVTPSATLAGGPVELELAPGGTASVPLTLGNLEGLADLTFEVSELAGAGAHRNAYPGPATPPGPSNQRPAGYAAAAPDGQIQAGSVLVLIDAQPFGTVAIQDALELNQVSYDVAGSTDFGTIDLTRYEAVFVGNDQPPGFYAALTAHLDRFEAYVRAGGFLWLGGTGWGFNGGEPDGVPLPGGGTINGPVFEEQNQILAPDHPLVAGVTDPITLEFASHSVFSGFPGGTTIAVGAGSGQATLAEYDLGAGRVVVVGQPVEFGYRFGLDIGRILANGVPYAIAFDPAGDVPWLAADPTAGAVAAGGSQAIAVTVDASDLPPGVHRAELVIDTNDPVNHRFTVPVTLTVTSR